MDRNRPHILCTIALEQSLIDKVTDYALNIDVQPFITTISVTNQEIITAIHKLGKQSINVVFTSQNAVQAVAEKVIKKPDWRIYCIGHATQKAIAEQWGQTLIKGTADNAAALAEIITKDHQTKEVTFFCGSQRRDELPEKLKEAHIGVQEVVVYETKATPVKVQKDYDAVLFFSPSGVDSYFSMNTVQPKTVLFAIGQTTALAIKKHTNNQIIISEQPGKGYVTDLVTDYYKTVKTA